MRVRRLELRNFRGISEGRVDFNGHTLLVGGNNVGKSTVCEALDLVMGPERLFRRPIIDEHDFFQGRYLDEGGASIDIRIEVILLDLSEEALRRFGGHLRRWNDEDKSFIDEGGAALNDADAPNVVWALPLVFIGRYDRSDDDFVGNTFFLHPEPEPTEDPDEEPELGAGLTRFTREHKRLCGFVFLRTIRTGSRALSLQRGSLLDIVLKLSGDGAPQMWQDTLTRLQALDPAVGDIEQLREIRDKIRSRMGRFVNLPPGDEATAFFASDLTREHLREVVRLFVATEPGSHLVPFNRLGTGSVNLLVFALLTFIAELKDRHSVIFAMEEPEIALPPHTQRRVTRFVLSEMGQTIVTSHSPYVIERFEPAQIVMLSRNGDGSLSGQPVDADDLKPKTYRTNSRQFAEAILSRAVLVVEGSTEASLLPVASQIMEQTLGADAYSHLDLDGVSIFNADGDGAVPRFGPVFASLGKLSFGFFDKPNNPLTNDAKTKLESYSTFWEAPQKGIENVLLAESPFEVVKRFMAQASQREDFPDIAPYNPEASQADILELARKVLKARKGEAFGYAAMLIAQCEHADELPQTVRGILQSIHDSLKGIPEVGEPPAQLAPGEDA